ncbi:serine/threonine protein kinase/beta-lactam-binding protein with PASTA domain [Aurantimicrobium minutum]|uniref:Stk1 family PASTA domain-containing Ser/Thr kinase n=1 Tax=Aurantimicrobium minutum TaxID=708131 RepID=UPI0024763BAF|nr:Stk1 family PASTA domain-containing Ser/Thr kinase [Aurantimicrobium minutum]MDH6532104.1 serine/threonine protein kinase/beta-lactam-binding protein with PASTA domain [Aurantimicrobium minutum]
MAQNKSVIAGRYELGKVLGTGGMADVYAAHDSVSGQKVALKLLNEELASNLKFRERFKQEARASASMVHPNIVRVLDAGEDTYLDDAGVEHTRSYLVMENVDGLELSKLVARGALKVTEAIRVAAELLSAVEYAHNAGIVHRDIKPSNIMLTRSGNVKILDFGIARAVSDTFDDLAVTTSILGTAAYFSPEQAKGQKVDARTDIYAIGIVLFEMLTGKVPFGGDTAVAVAHQHIHAQPVAPSSLNPKVSPALDAVVSKALSKAKTQRYQTTTAFGRALGEAAAGRVPAAPTPPSPVEELLGPISEPALAYTPTVNTELPADFAFLFGTDPQTAPTLIEPEQFRPPVKRVVAIVGVVALIFGAIMGMGLWVATLQPANLFPASTVTVPQLNNVTVSKAEAQLKDLGFITSQVVENSATTDKGKVIRTDPPKGTVVDPGSPIILFVSAGKTEVEVPQVADMTVPDATIQLEAAGFKVGTVTEGHSPSYSAGLVISTTPSLGTKLIQGSKVNLLVSDGKIEIPDLRGMSVTDANNVLSTLSITPTVQADTGCPKAATPTVKTQSVSPGVVPQGTNITITYCAG